MFCGKTLIKAKDWTTNNGIIEATKNNLYRNFNTCKRKPKESENKLNGCLFLVSISDY